MVDNKILLIRNKGIIKIDWKSKSNSNYNIVIINNTIVNDGVMYTSSSNLSSNTCIKVIVNTHKNIYTHRNID